MAFAEEAAAAALPEAPEPERTEGHETAAVAEAPEPEGAEGRVASEHCPGGRASGPRFQITMTDVRMLR